MGKATYINNGQKELRFIEIDHKGCLDCAIQKQGAKRV